MKNFGGWLTEMKMSSLLLCKILARLLKIDTVMAIFLWLENCYVFKHPVFHTKTTAGKTFKSRVIDVWKLIIQNISIPTKYINFPINFENHMLGIQKSFSN